MKWMTRTSFGYGGQETNLHLSCTTRHLFEITRSQQLLILLCIWGERTVPRESFHNGHQGQKSIEMEAKHPGFGTFFWGISPTLSIWPLTSFGDSSQRWRLVCFDLKSSDNGYGVHFHISTRSIVNPMICIHFPMSKRDPVELVYSIDQVEERHATARDPWRKPSAP